MTAGERTPEEVATRVMGRILGAHLCVEHFVTEYLQAKNPSLGGLSSARLTFAQKVELVGGVDPAVPYLVPGLRRLNKTRNRLAHSLNTSVTNEDRDVLLLIELFRALRDALASPAVASVEPVDVQESFAQHAGMALNAAADPWAGFWIKAIVGQSADES